ncbi:MAG: OadG family protein [Chloroflexota bacterium]
MSNYNLGLTISMFGIGITFLALTAIILLIKFLLWIFPAKPEKQPTQGITSDLDLNIAHVAAFAAAWWSRQEPANSSLGDNLEKAHGNWWANSSNQDKYNAK